MEHMVTLPIEELLNFLNYVICTWDFYTAYIYIFQEILRFLIIETVQITLKRLTFRFSTHWINAYLLRIMYKEKIFLD